MTKNEAIRVVKALNDIEDFEALYDEIQTACQHVEGNFADFIHCQLYPLMDAELKRREQILKEM